MPEVLHWQPVQQFRLDGHVTERRVGHPWIHQCAVLCCPCSRHSLGEASLMDDLQERHAFI